MGKYIIDIEDGKECIVFCQTGIVVVGSHLNDEDSLKPLGIKSAIPYIEPSRGEIYKKAYQVGLNDAWDAARKISTMDSTTRDKIFKKVITTSIIEGNTASEAIEKIRQYEQEKEEQIQVGDEVIGIFSSGEHTKPFVITKWNSDYYYFGIYSDSGEFCQGGLKLQKTGRHFPEIAEVIKKMQEKKS